MKTKLNKHWKLIGGGVTTSILLAGCIIPTSLILNQSFSQQNLINNTYLNCTWTVNNASYGNADATKFFDGNVSGNVVYQINASDQIEILDDATITNETTISTSIFGSDLKLKATFDSKQIVAIQASAFIHTDDSEKIRNNISGSLDLSTATYLTTIGSESFATHPNLTSVSIGENVSSIGTDAFMECPLSSISLDAKNTYFTQLDMSKGEESGTVVVSNATLNGGKLTDSSKAAGNLAAGTIYFSSTNTDTAATAIAAGAFMGCYGIKKVILPDWEGFNTVNYSSFYNCINFSSLTIPHNIQVIHDNAFVGCDLSEVDVTNINTSYFNVISFGSSGFAVVDNTTTSWTTTSKITTGLAWGVIDYPQSVSTVASEAFYKCCGITAVRFANTIESIGQDAFYGCKNLSFVNLSGCSNLLSIAGAFSSCSNLTNVDLTNCSKLNNIGAAFADTGLTSISMADCAALTTVGDGAFQSCYNLTAVTFSPATTQILDGSFSETGIIDLKLPKNITSIDNYCFLNMYGKTATHLKNIEIEPGGTTPFAIFQAGKTGRILVNKNDSQIWTNDSYAVAGIACGDIDLSDQSFTILNPSAFAGSQIESIKLPSSIESISVADSSASFYPFMYCVYLENVNFSELSNLKTIGDYAFAYASQLSSTIIIPSSVSYIGFASLMAIGVDYVMKPRVIEFLNPDPSWTEYKDDGAEEPTQTSGINEKWLSTEPAYITPTVSTILVPKDSVETYQAFVLEHPDTTKWFTSDMHFEAIPDPTPTPTDNNNLGLILGLSLGIGIPVVAGTTTGIVVGVKKHKNKNKKAKKPTTKKKK